MLNEIISNIEVFSHRDVYSAFFRLFDADPWQSILHTLGQEQTILLGPQRKKQEQIITDLQSILQILTKDTCSIHWAFAHTILGMTYTRRLAGSKQKNIEQAKFHCQTALTVLTRDNAPQPWALLQLTLGEVYRSSLIGERKENLMQALVYCSHALQVHTHDIFPFKWAITHATLGHVYIELGGLVSTQADELAQALEHYQQALQILTEENSPAQWAIIQQRLAIISIMRRDGSKFQHLQQAITLGQSSLRVLTRTTYPLEWARVHAYLGEAYRQATMYTDLQELYSGRSVMQEQALKHIEAALQVYTMQDYPDEWAKVKDFEGMIYRERVRGQQLENQEQARHCFQAARNVCATN